jgi:hypothetical protein
LAALRPIRLDGLGIDPNNEFPSSVGATAVDLATGETVYTRNPVLARFEQLH